MLAFAQPLDSSLFLGLSLGFCLRYIARQAGAGFLIDEYLLTGAKLVIQPSKFSLRRDWIVSRVLFCVCNLALYGFNISARSFQRISLTAHTKHGVPRFLGTFLDAGPCLFEIAKVLDQLIATAIHRIGKGLLCQCGGVGRFALIFQRLDLTINLSGQVALRFVELERGFNRRFSEVFKLLDGFANRLAGGLLHLQGGRRYKLKIPRCDTARGDGLLQGFCRCALGGAGRSCH